MFQKIHESLHTVKLFLLSSILLCRIVFLHFLPVCLQGDEISSSCFFVFTRVRCFFKVRLEELNAKLAKLAFQQLCEFYRLFKTVLSMTFSRCPVIFLEWKFSSFFDMTVRFVRSTHSWWGLAQLLRFEKQTHAFPVVHKWISSIVSKSTFYLFFSVSMFSLYIWTSVLASSW